MIKVSPVQPPKASKRDLPFAGGTQSRGRVFDMPSVSLSASRGLISRGTRKLGLARTYKWSFSTTVIV